MECDADLEEDLQGELDLARPAERRGDLACGGQVEGPAWNSQAGMIQQVEDFGAELHGAVLAEPRERRVFDDRQIQGAVVGTVHNAAAGIAVKPEIWERERTGIIEQLGSAQWRTPER